MNKRDKISRQIYFHSPLSTSTSGISGGPYRELYAGGWISIIFMYRINRCSLYFNDSNLHYDNVVLNLAGCALQGVATKIIFSYLFLERCWTVCY